MLKNIMVATHRNAMMRLDRANPISTANKIKVYTERTNYTIELDTHEAFCDGEVYQLTSSVTNIILNSLEKNNYKVASNGTIVIDIRAELFKIANNVRRYIRELGLPYIQPCIDGTLITLELNEKTIYDYKIDLPELRDIETVLKLEVMKHRQKSKMSSIHIGETTYEVLT